MVDVDLHASALGFHFPMVFAEDTLNLDFTFECRLDILRNIVTQEIIFVSPATMCLERVILAFMMLCRLVKVSYL